MLRYTLQYSPLWKEFQVLHLTKNMRTAPGAGEFATYLDRIGRGVDEDEDEERMVELPRQICMETEEAVIDWTFSTAELQNDEALRRNCILTVTNAGSLEINEKVVFFLMIQVVSGTGESSGKACGISQCGYLP